MRLKKLKFTLLSLAVCCLMPGLGYSATVSFDHFTANSQYGANFHTNLNTALVNITDGVNNVESDQVTNDTLAEADMADEINPRIRTYEEAGCEYVYSGLLPATDTDLTSDISAGTAYPRGYRCVKASGTAHTYTSGKWTYVDIDQNCDFQYSEVAVGAATPSIASNSIRLARASTDSGVIDTVTDLRTTSCVDGPFENISDTATGATLDDLLTYGSPIKENGTDGYIQGLQIIWNVGTSFIVKDGCAYINGEFRCLTSDETVPTTADNPSTGVSGIDTGSIAASTLYNIFAVADQDSVNTMSISYGTGASPSGATNYRKIGSITTDPSSSFVSGDMYQLNNVNDRELALGWATFDGSAAALAVADKFNVSGIVANGTGDYTISWDRDMANTYYPVQVTAGRVIDTSVNVGAGVTKTAGTCRVFTVNGTNDAKTDSDVLDVTAFGRRYI